MFVVVAYDIVDDRKRTQVAKLMKQYGVRVQKSVFECILDDRRYLRMKEQIEKLIDWDEDGVRYYTLCMGCVKNIETSGVGIVLDEEELIIV